MLKIRETSARHHRQRHGVVRRRGGSPRLHRAHRPAVPRFPDGQGRDGRQPSAVGRRGAQPRAAGSRRDRADGRAVELDHAFRPAAAVQQERAHRAARYLAGSDQPERSGRGGAGRRRQGDRRAAEQGAGKLRVLLSGGYRLAQGDRREIGREREADQADDRRRVGADELLPRVPRHQRPGSPRTPSSSARARTRWISAARRCRTSSPRTRLDAGSLRHHGRRHGLRAGRRRGASGPADRFGVRRLGDRLLRHGDGNGLPPQDER